MKQYKVTVNGLSYEIAVEEMGVYSGGPVPAAAVAPVPKAAPARPAAEPAPTPVGGETVLAPMPGTILSVNVAVGTAVERGQVLMILEAMKMENEILSPCAGKIVALNAAQGSAVETNTALCVIQ